ncbi:MAG: MarR family transcriptional regulator [Chloroflexota bacterium]
MSSSKSLPHLDNTTFSEDSIYNLMPYVGLLLSKAALKVNHQVDASLEPYGVQIKHFCILLLLTQVNSTLSQKEIGRRLWIDRNTMVSLIDHLEARELAVRTRDPNDRRSYAISATEKGRRLVLETDQIVAKADLQFVEELSSGELEQLTNLLLRLLRGTREKE